jgi:hypothetical protein
MEDFKEIQEALDKFEKQLPSIQNSILDQIRVELKDLSIKNGNIIVSGENIRKVAAIKSRLLNIILSPEYVKSVKELLSTYDTITSLQNQYFNTVSTTFSPPAFSEELKNQAKTALANALTERGIEANVLAGIEDILTKNITTGGSYTELAKALEDNITNNETGEGKMLRYAKQITTDALNQYSAQYTQLVSSDLGYEWFYYAGSLIETSRPFCLACRDKKYIHISEFPALLAGDFPEFAKYDGVLYKGLPAGMYPDTTVSNFQINRGGYNCGHQLRPISEGQVPLESRNKVYATVAYQVWKNAA